MDSPSTPAKARSAIVHPSSIIHQTATLGHEVDIGPFCVVGPHVQIGDGTKLLPHVSIVGHTTVGQRCTIFPHATIGAVAQHVLWRGGDEVRVLIGNDCLIRENVTIHRSTHGLDRPTTVGNRALIMTGVHVAHDVVLEDDVILVTGIGLAGHVRVGKNAIVGGMSAVAQWAHIGEHAFVAAGSVVTRNVIPFSLVKGDRARTLGINVVGLKRLDWDDAKIEKLIVALPMVLGNDKTGITTFLTDETVRDEVHRMIDFCTKSERGLCLPPGAPGFIRANKL
ncbi:bacterial transferase hexapeptide [Colletotrichum plurivorum]|uniref:Bacterial transferase hexapeptide n=1 Tax=Colletotrichum plurivorum TaxID=2175906 RepID=A0A8H6JHF3_9PEZI|nr:bacterial transferase hexapeptide [Colletotrichum plurivorum]